MTESEFTGWLRSLPREKTPEQVDQAEHQHDLERGLYSPPGETTHSYGESRH